MTHRPLIAVVAYHLGDERVSRWPRGGYGVPAPYIEAMRRAGARPLILAPGEPGEAHEILEPFDGLLLVGGGDVDPALYGEASRRHVYGVEPDRDRLEIELLLEADRMALSTLCICRGMQVMNVAFGGSLYGHLPDVTGLLEHGVPVADTQTVHDVAVEPDTRLGTALGRTSVECSSHHHQGVDRVAYGLKIAGRSPDGLVEAIERDVQTGTAGTWMVGVQWHPEDTAGEDPAQQALFDSFANAALQRVSSDPSG
jgi:putative glutamine amidotransferase